MATIAEKKQAILKEYQIHDKDTGSSEVQIALLSKRISELTEHLKMHKNDLHSRRGLIAMTNRRRNLLNYLKSNDLAKYQEIIGRLGIRR